MSDWVQRYEIVRKIDEERWICRDVNLGREVCIRWLSGGSRLADVATARIGKILEIRSPYLAQVYDVWRQEPRAGVVEEHLPDGVAVADANRMVVLYQFCCAVAALHQAGLAHGALQPAVFRQGPLGAGRLCNMRFVEPGLDEPETDRAALSSSLQAMGASDIADAELQRILGQLQRGEVSVPIGSALVRDRLAALLLRDRHRALVNWQGGHVELGAGRRSMRLAHPMPGVAEITLGYDGTRFSVQQVSGEVKINNTPPAAGDELPASCVVVLGDSHRPWHQRYSVTFDQSHPEVRA